MSRDLAAAISNALDDEIINVFWTCDLLFDAPNALYFWNGIGDLVLGSQTYTGVGNLLQISELRESSDIASYGATLTLSGIPTNEINLALAEPYQGRRAVVKFGVRPRSAYPQYDIRGQAPTLIADFRNDIYYTRASYETYFASTVFQGEMDEMNISFGPDTCTISLQVESRLVDLNRPRIRRYTDADHQARYPGDLAFEFVTRLQNESLQWEAS